MGQLRCQKCDTHRTFCVPRAPREYSLEEMNAKALLWAAAARGLPIRSKHLSVWADPPPRRPREVSGRSFLRDCSCLAPLRRQRCDTYHSFGTLSAPSDYSLEQMNVQTLLWAASAGGRPPNRRHERRCRHVAKAPPPCGESVRWSCAMSLTMSTTWKRRAGDIAMSLKSPASFWS